MTLTLNLPDELHRQLEGMAQERKISVESIALESWRTSRKTDASVTWSSEAARETS